MPEWLKKFTELNPVLIRGLLITIAALIAKAVGHTVIDNDTIELVIDLIVGLSALITALWTRTMVIAERKVVAWKPDPDIDDVHPGIATTEDYEGLMQAGGVSKTQTEVRRDLADAA